MRQHKEYNTAIMKHTKVIFADLPCTCKGLVVRMFDDGEDYDTIVLNSRLNWEQNIETYLHELIHIDRDDFNSYLPVSVREKTNPY